MKKMSEKEREAEESLSRELRNYEKDTKDRMEREQE